MLNRLAGLPFVEQVAYGLAYRQEVRAGLLADYVQTAPDLLRQAADLATSAYWNHPDSAVGLSEFVYCQAIAGDEELVLALIQVTAGLLGTRRAWQAVLAVFDRRRKGASCWAPNLCR